MVRSNRSSALRVSAASILLFAAAMPHTAAVVVEFGDNVIEAKVRTIIGRLDDEPIEDTELVGVGFTNLDIVAFGIEDLSGLEYCLDLTTIDLSDNVISDISVLAALEQLETVVFQRNRISDLSPLSGLPNITTLNLAENLVSDIEALRDLTTLRVLNLDDNGIESIASLEGLTALREVGLANNLIVDASPLVSNFGLGFADTVNLIGNPLSELSVCESIPALEDRGVAVSSDSICPGVILGEVLDADTGEPISCAVVIPVGSLFSAALGPTDLDGQYQLNDLPAGAYNLEAHAPGYEAAPGTGTVEASGMDEVIFRLQPVARDDVVPITGAITDAATGLTLAGVEATAVVGAFILDRAFTCATGEYELLLPAGQSGGVTIAFSAPGFMGDSFTLETVAAGEISTALMPQASFSGSVSGFVSDGAAEGAPLEGARVTVLPVGAALAFATATGADGGYLVPNLADGAYTVQFSSPIHPGEGFYRDIEVEGGQVLLDVSIGTAPPTMGCAALGSGWGNPSLLLGDTLVVLMAMGCCALFRRRVSRTAWVGTRTI